MKLKLSLQIISIVIIVAALLITFYEVQKAERFPIETVKITASFAHVSQEQLQTVVAPFTEKSFFALNVSELQHDLLQIPWVNEASVFRKWPNALKINITEHQAYVRWRHDGVMTPTGHVFYPGQDSISNELPRLHGPLGFETKLLQNYRNMSKMLEKIDVSIVELTLSDRLAWSLRLNNDTQLLLGREEAMKRLARFVAIYHTIKANDKQHADKVDLRYPHGFAVRWVDKNDFKKNNNDGSPIKHVKKN